MTRKVGNLVLSNFTFFQILILLSCCLWRLTKILADKKEENHALLKDSILTELPLVMGFTDSICVSLSFSMFNARHGI